MRFFHPFAKSIRFMDRTARMGLTPDRKLCHGAEICADSFLFKKKCVRFIIGWTVASDVIPGVTDSISAQATDTGCGMVLADWAGMIQTTQGIGDFFEKRCPQFSLLGIKSFRGS